MEWIWFEGEYINGERNGKGFEFGLYPYDGEYLKGKKHGRGKEYKDYDDEFKVSFEGEYYNNYKLKGKHYINGKLEYEGE